MSSKSAATSESLLDELQTTLAHGTVARRVETLRRVTDLFINGAVDYSDEQIELFDDVFQCLIASHRDLGQGAARQPPGPDRHRAAAHHSHAGVRRPHRGRRLRCCRRSERLDDEALIETARSKSQAHLMAISTRRVLSGAVTDVLVLRGNDEVIQSTVNNPGAEFSERGFTRLVESRRGRRRSRDLHRPASDDSAASLSETDREGVGDGAGSARGRQSAAGGRRAERGAGGDAARAFAPSAVTQETAIAHALVKSLYEDGRLDEHQVAAFADAGKFDEANAAIAALANVSVSIAENMMVETRAEGVMILAKVSGMSWSTVKAIINMRDDLSGLERDRSRGLQGHLRTAAALDRAAGAALPPHAADAAPAA